MKVITISAKARHGKDFVANKIKNELEDLGNKVLICHYADLLKYICKTFFDWNGEKDNYGRSLLQKVGTEKIRNYNPNYWVNFICDILRFFPNEWDYILIPDCRFPNEVDVMKIDFNVTSLHIIRPNFDNGLTEEQKNHPSETSMDNYNFDYTLVNDGTDNINKEVNKFIDYLLV